MALCSQQRLRFQRPFVQKNDSWPTEGQIPLGAVFEGDGVLAVREFIWLLRSAGA
jgi:hypothetical protein